MQNLAQEPRHVTVGGIKLNKMMYEGLPVVTFDMIDKAHQRPEGTIS